MKLNYSENQYEQLAKEQLCRTFNNIPFVSDVEIITITERDCGFDFYALVHYSDTNEVEKLYVNVKSNGEKRFVNSFMQMASMFNDDACYVFMAPYISEISADSLIKNHFSFMDLSGNCYILSKRIILHYQGKENKFIVKREKKQYFSKSSTAASAIMRTLLDKPYACWGVKLLSEITGKAIGTVSNVKSFLKDRDWIEEYQHGFELKNIKELLHTWAKDYHQKDSLTFEYYSLDSIAELERRISEWSKTHDNSALLGGFSAAARYAPTVRYKKVDVYVEQQAYSEFIKDLELKQVESGGNIVITIPHDETPCMFFREVNGDYITSPVQTVIDLLGNAGRGEEAADAVILKEFEQK